MDVYATDKTMLKGNVSFTRAGELKDAAGLDQPFNTPEFTFNLGLSTADFLAEGINLDLSLRHVDAFDYQEGVHVGTVPAYTVVDANLSYRTRFGVVYKITARNLLGNDHIEVVDGARIGRIVVGEIQYGF